MPTRSALIINDAGGPQTVVAGVLKRFDFSVPQRATSVAAAIDKMRARAVDLVFVPLDRITAEELVALELALHDARSIVAIGTAAATDPQLIVRAMRAGIHEFLVSPIDAAELTAAMERLVKRAPADARLGQVIAMHSAKGGLGSTSLTVNLAYALAANRPDARVAIVDLVIASGDVKIFLNLETSYDISDLVCKLDRADSELLFSLLTPGAGERVWVLPAPDDPEVEDVLDAAAIGGVIGRLREHFDYVLLDCEHHMSERTLAAMDAADRIVLLTELNVAALRSAERTVGLCQRLGHSAEKLCVVVNRHRPDDMLSLDDAAKVLTRDVFATLPNNYVLAFEAVTHGVPLARLAPKAPLTKAITALAAKLDGAAHANDQTARRSRFGRLFGMIRRA